MHETQKVFSRSRGSFWEAFCAEWRVDALELNTENQKPPRDTQTKYERRKYHFTQAQTIKINQEYIYYRKSECLPMQNWTSWCYCAGCGCRDAEKKIVFFFSIILVIFDLSNTLNNSMCRKALYNSRCFFETLSQIFWIMILLLFLQDSSQLLLKSTPAGDQKMNRTICRTQRPFCYSVCVRAKERQWSFWDETFSTRSVQPDAPAAGSERFLTDPSPWAPSQNEPLIGWRKQSPFHLPSGC